MTPTRIRSPGPFETTIPTDPVKPEKTGSALLVHSLDHFVCDQLHLHHLQSVIDPALEAGSTGPRTQHEADNDEHRKRDAGRRDAQPLLCCHFDSFPVSQSLLE